MASSVGVNVYVTHVIDPLNFYARIGNGMLFTLHSAYYVKFIFGSL